MHELKKAIEEVLEHLECGEPGCQQRHFIVTIPIEAVQHLREVYEAVKEKM